MGPIWLWLIPLRYEDFYNGYSFKINKKTKRDMEEIRLNFMREKIRL